MSIYEDQPPVPPSPVSQPPRSRPWRPIVTQTLMAVTIGVYLIQMATQFSLGVDLPAAFGMKVNTLIIQGQLWRLLTPVFLHASLLHIGFNMYALFALGSGLERYYGRRRFIWLYFLSGFAGNVASFIFSSASSLGASTAVFGLLGAQGVFLYQNRELFGPQARRSLTNVITIALVNLMIGLSPGIDNWGHLGGLVGGTMYSWFAGPLFQRRDPLYSNAVVDERSSGNPLWTGVLIAGLFALIAGVKIWLSLR